MHLKFNRIYRRTKGNRKKNQDESPSERRVIGKEQ